METQAEARFRNVEVRFAEISQILDEHEAAMKDILQIVDKVVSVLEDTERRQDALRGNRTSKA